ncbi:hypothetical protein CSUI_007071 [Cystoisospora suis]|uniref:Uncharacterized protein n=1 Tax=Cystoisospora suis TaxID=483139 RepID=A0A2C6KS96_9APIC|nr:hypothetical protein CSUI_007071 [Cystoisospora suis]
MESSDASRAVFQRSEQEKAKLLNAAIGTAAWGRLRTPFPWGSDSHCDPPAQPRMKDTLLRVTRYTCSSSAKTSHGGGLALFPAGLLLCLVPAPIDNAP